MPSSTQPQGSLHVINNVVSPPPTTEQPLFPSDLEDAPFPSSNDDDNDENGNILAHLGEDTTDFSEKTAACFDNDDRYEANVEDNDS